jgi:hypothetical protein
MLQNVVFITFSLIAGTIIGVSALWVASGLIFYFCFDASWQRALGVGMWGALPSAILGWVAGTIFGLFRSNSEP